MIDQLTKEILEKIKNEINQEYGFYYETPRINYGPCGVFAKIFYETWNKLFKDKLHICFVMTKTRDECDHIVVRLPSGELYDGGIRIHSDKKYLDKFIIEDMLEYDEERLEKWSYGLERIYPRYCPNFKRGIVEKIIKDNLESLYYIQKSL